MTMIASKIDRQWIADTTVAPYVWEQLSPDGKLVVQSEWNQDFTAETPLAQIAAEVKHPVGPPDPVSGVRHHVSTWRVRSACKMRARPLRDSLPVLEIDLNPGDELVWSHRKVRSLGLMGASSSISFESIIFGRIVNGNANLAQIHPNGEVHGHASIDEALALL